jgi:ribosomal protein S12 methylthiotransferase accessory factor
LKSHWRPKARTEVAHGPEAARNGWDDLESYPCLDLTGIGESVAGLLRRFHKAGLPVLARDITSDLGIPTVLAAAAEDNVPGFPQAHFGLGTHPDICTAAARALSELAQSRCVDIQGVREDITAPDDDTSISIHTRRVAHIDRRSWINAPSAALRSWRDVPTCWNADILDDIRLMLERIRSAGIRHAVLVDLSLPEEGIYVVRVIVPGLESWVIDQGRIGWRATNFWRSLAA